MFFEELFESTEALADEVIAPLERVSMEQRIRCSADLISEPGLFVIEHLVDADGLKWLDPGDDLEDYTELHGNTPVLLVQKMLSQR